MIMNHISKFDDFLNEKKKLDPKAEVRNRGEVVFPAGSKDVNDNADHFPINDVDQARNALARAGQYSRVPKWYNGTLTELKEKITKKVHSTYSEINISELEEK